jgi:methyl-accepting chemotaxis protein
MNLNAFKPQKIKGKLLLAFGTVLFLSSILAGWGYYSINRIMEIRSLEKDFKNISLTTLKMRKAEKDFLMRETKSKDFMATGASKYITDMNEYVALEDSLTKSLLEKGWASDLEIVDELETLSSNFKDYGSVFNKILR